MEKHHLFADGAGTQALEMAFEKIIIKQNAIILHEIRNWMDQFKKNLPGDIIESGGECYIPMQTFSDIAASVTCYVNLVYNHQAVFAIEFQDLT